MAKSRKKKTASHGGVRTGAGRPSLADKKRMISVYLPESLIKYLDGRPEGRSAALVKILTRLNR